MIVVATQSNVVRSRLPIVLMFDIRIRRFNSRDMEFRLMECGDLSPLSTSDEKLRLVAALQSCSNHQASATLASPLPPATDRTAVRGQARVSSDPALPADRWPP